MGRKDKAKIEKMQNPCLLLLLLLPFSFAVDKKELFVNGANAREGQRIALPWKVSISFGGFHFCYGAAISDTLVLTAGSCLAIFDKDTTLDVVFADGQWTTSSETIVHPDFDSASLFADLGMIRLSQPFQVFATFPIHLVLNTGSNTSLITQVVPLALPLPGEILQEGETICLEDQLHALLCLRVLSPTACLAINEDFPEGVICVQSKQEDGECSAGTLQPGNPGVVRHDELPWTLGGVMSNNGGLTNCQAGFPFWMTSTEFFVEWIKDVMTQGPAVI